MKSKRSAKDKREKREKQDFRFSWAFYLLLFILIILYAISGIALLGIATILLLLLIVYLEVKYSVKNEGAKKSIMDIASAVGTAVVVWVLLVLILQTSAPVDAVSSCSMLPVLHRGDLVILHGLGNVSQFVANSHVPVVNITQSAFQQMESRMSSEFLAFFAYFNGNKSSVSYPIANISSPYNIGLYSTSCLSYETYTGKQSQFYSCYANPQSQLFNLIRYNYSIGNLTVNNQVLKAPYTSQIMINGKSIVANYSNPIIVYQTTSKDTFTGSVIHRLFAVLNVSGTYYFLTKGDNNQALDVEFGNYPANRSEVLGYVIADIPIVGYIKLLFSGQIETPQGCNTLLRR